MHNLYIDNSAGKALGGDWSRVKEVSGGVEGDIYNTNHKDNLKK